MNTLYNISVQLITSYNLPENFSLKRFQISMHLEINTNMCFPMDLHSTFSYYAVLYMYTCITIVFYVHHQLLACSYVAVSVYAEIII